MPVAVPPFRGPEHRTTARVPWNRKVSLWGIDSPAMARNISEGGLFVSTTAVLPMGRPVWLAIEIDGHTFQVLAQVVHGAAPSGYGLKFVSVEPDAEARVRRIVAQSVPSATG
jgi:Tfp pilus assembly protein PilZ